LECTASDAAYKESGKAPHQDVGRCQHSSDSSVASGLFIMSNFDAAPPNTHAGGDDDALRTKGNDPMNPADPPQYGDENVDMVAYSKDVPLWKRVYQHSLTQMMLLSVQAFCGPAMTDAIAGAYSSSQRAKIPQTNLT
jgi:hypothetical protein